MKKHIFSITRLITAGRGSRQKRQKNDGRRQFNFSCDKDLAERLKVTAKFIGVPIYPLVEHVAELGLTGLKVNLEDKMLRQLLKKHIIQRHLLQKQLNSVTSETDAK